MPHDRLNKPRRSGMTQEITILEKWAISIQELLRASHKVSSAATRHKNILGDAREFVIREILTRFLPSSVLIGTGIIVDSNGKPSNQIDIILYRQNFPIFRSLGSQDTFLLEGVLATIEVKSKLDEKALKEALENYKSVKRLKPCYDTESAQAFCHKQNIDLFQKENGNRKLDERAQDEILKQILPATYIFGYEGYTNTNKGLASLKKALYKWYIGIDQNSFFAPEAIITKGCVVVKNDLRPFRAPSPNCELVHFVAARDSAPVKYLLHHLLYRLAESAEFSMATHVETGIMLDSHPHNLIRLAENWTGWGKKEEPVSLDSFLQSNR